MGPGDEALPSLPAGDGAAGGVCALRVPREGESAGLSWGREEDRGPRES